MAKKISIEFHELFLDERVGHYLGLFPHCIEYIIHCTQDVWSSRSLYFKRCATHWYHLHYITLYESWFKVISRNFHYLSKNGNQSVDSSYHSILLIHYSTCFWPRYFLLRDLNFNSTGEYMVTVRPLDFSRGFWSCCWWICWRRLDKSGRWHT